MGGLVAVDQDKTRERVQGVDGELHRQHGRLEDIEGIDHLLLDYAEADGRRFGLDRGIELLAPPCAEELRVAHPLDRTGRGKDHSGGHNRPRQRPASDLVNTRNKLIPCRAKAGFYLCGPPRNAPLQLSLRSEILAALPLSFRR